MTAKPAQEIFRKRHAHLSIEDPFQRPIEHQSRRTPAAIFPDPDRWPRGFDVAARIPAFWQTVKDADGEILLTREQIQHIRDILIRERKDELHAKYTEIMANFTARYERAIRCAVASHETNSVSE